MPSPFPNLPPEHRGTIHRISHHSTALEGNPWNDPLTRDVWVYEPKNPNNIALPCIFILPAFAGTGEGFFARGLTELSMSARLDRLHADGCPPFIAVMPDTMTSVGGSQYLDSPGIGNYATYIVRELKDAISNTFHTNRQWGVIGRSSGGFGALHLAMSYPGSFDAVGCHAGDMGFDLMFLGELGPAIQGVQELGGIRTFHEKFWERNRPNPAQFAAFNLIAMAYAYQKGAFDPDNGPALPVNLDTGEVHYEVIKDWMQFDPVVLIERPEAREALRALKCLYIDVGNKDEYQLHLGARRFTTSLAEAGIDYIYEEFDGGHRGTAYRFNHSLPILSKALQSLPNPPDLLPDD